MLLRDCAREIPRVEELETSLRQVRQDLRSQGVVAVWDGKSWRALRSEGALGHGDCRLLVDLHLDEVPVLPADLSVGDALVRLADTSAVGAFVEDRGELAGWVTREELLEGLAGEEGSRRELEAALEALPAVLWRWKGRGEPSLGSLAFLGPVERVLGWPASHLSAAEDPALFHPGDRQALRELFDPERPEAERVVRWVRIRGQDGSWRLLKGIRWRGGDGRRLQGLFLPAEEARAEHRAFQLRVLDHLAAELPLALDLGKALHHVCRSLREVLDHDLVGALFWGDGDLEFLLLPRRPTGQVALREAAERLAAAYESVTGESVPQEVLARVRAAPDWAPESAAPVERLRSSFVTPVGSQDRPMGVVLVASEAEGAFTAEDEHFVQAVFERVGRSMAQLRRLERVEQEVLEQLLEHLPEAVALVEASGRVRAWNRLALEYLGTLADWEPGGRLEAVAGRPLADLLAQEEPWEVERPGRVFRVEARPVASGQAVVVIRDVTRLRRMERQARIQERLAALGRLAGGVAHDFNNLLTVIFWSVDLASATLPAGHPALAELEQIREAAGRAAEMTRKLLAFGRRQVLKPALVRVEDVLDDLGAVFGRLLGSGVFCSVDVQPGVWPVFVDRGELERALVNLVANARDALSGGGQVLVSARNVVLGPADVPEEVAPGPYVRISVSDTGAGMPPEVVSRAFEPFFSTKDPTSGQGAGTGLGLAMVYGLARQSGGFAAIHSEVGHGTTVDIYLPRAEAGGSRGGSAGTRQETRPKAPGEETVLVVENAPEVRRLMARILEGVGYRVLEAADALEAIQAVTGHGGPVHLLVTDVGLPQASGAELAARLRAMEPGLKVLYVSGGPGGEELPEGAPEGVFLSKPFSVGRLLEAALQALCNDRRQGQEG